MGISSIFIEGCKPQLSVQEMVNYKFQERLVEEYLNSRDTIEMIRESNRKYIDIALSCKCKK